MTAVDVVSDEASLLHESDDLSDQRRPLVIWNQGGLEDDDLSARESVWSTAKDLQFKALGVELKAGLAPRPGARPLGHRGVFIGTVRGSIPKEVNSGKTEEPLL